MDISELREKSKLQNRFRSRTAWAAILSLVLFVSKTYLGYEFPEGDKLIELILISFSAIGVFNNPQNPNAY